LGAALTLTLVNVFPARRTRDILSVIAVLAAGGIVLLFRSHPTRAARATGGLPQPRGLHRGAAHAHLAPAAERVGAEGDDGVPRTDETDWLAVYLLWTTAAAAVVLGALLHRWLYLTGLQQGAGERAALREAAAAPWRSSVAGNPAGAVR
jgi:hypothetical protein